MRQTKTMSLLLRELTVKNFKCFKKEQKISFGKITVLTGANSSGKSSIFHAILGTIQSGEFPYNFSTNGKYVDMGDFKDISNHHLSKDITINMVFQDLDLESALIFNLKTIWSNNIQNSLPQLKFLSIDSPGYKLELKKKGTSYLLFFSYDPKVDPEYSIEQEKKMKDRMLRSFVQRQSNNQTKDKNEYNKELKNFKKFVSTVYNIAEIKDFKISDIDRLYIECRVHENFHLNYYIDGILGMLAVDYNSNINAISSFRLHPERTYLEQSKDKLKIEKFGQGYLDQILLWHRKDKKKFNNLVKVMNNMRLLHNITPHRIEGGRFEVHVKTKESGIETSIIDVGFGVSQFIPILVADFQLKENSTLFIAEPEIHLHPNVQAEFANYIINRVYKEHKNYVIETHSEYFLNRLRLEIVKGNLKESDICVYYLENDGEDVQIHELKFGMMGEISGAPPSFFDTYMMDLKKLAYSVKI